MEKIKEWIVPAFIVMFLLIGFTISNFTKDCSATRKINKLEVGDKFNVEFITENPYENNIVFGGTIIAKHGNYIQYVNEKGDTASTNIRDAYRYPKMFKVTVTKSQQK